MVLLLDRESASELFLNALLGLFRCPPGSGRTLIGGTLPLRYCVARFACSTPTWRLPASGYVRRLVAAHDEAAGGCGDEVSGFRVSRVSRSRPLRKRFRSEQKKLQHTLWGYWLILVHAFGRDCVKLISQDFPCLITLGGVVIMLMGALFMSMTELGSGDFPGLMWIYTHS